MSLLIKNASLWQWSTGVSKLTSSSCGYNIVFKRWIEVGIDGRFNFPKDSNDEEVIPAESNYSACIDAHGRLVLPGLIDSHIHVSMTGESIHFLDLKDCFSIEQLVDALQLHISNHGDLSWIIGVNWDQVWLYSYI